MIEHRSYHDPFLHGKLVRYSVHLAHGDQRLRAATPAELDMWTDRILDAKTLDAVFASA